MNHQIKTVADVIDALGGRVPVAKMFGVTQNAVSQWKTRGFPPETYVAFTCALRKRRLSASASLWQMREIQETTD
jgi:hypothetical protein